jgi:hypothetical protein
LIPPISDYVTDYVTISGVMNAADYYGLEELKSACTGFIQVKEVCCLNFQAGKV